MPTPPPADDPTALFDVPLSKRFGQHRVLEPQGVLPQPAWRVDSTPERAENDCEILLDVERLNVDAASFLQMEEDAKQAGEDVAEGVKRRVLDTVRQRGKMHNPVTGSGGMLLGRVRSVGARLRPPHSTLAPGERVATLVSLSLTPLRIDAVEAVHLHTHQLTVRGTAVLFASGAWARLPSYLPENVALSALDVAGAAPQVLRLCARPRDGVPVSRVLVLGCGGKSGLLCGAAARRAGVPRVIGVETNERAAADAEQLGIFDHVLRMDASDAVRVATESSRAAGGEFDLAISCVSAKGAEMSAILPTRDGGTVYFFSMATSFTAAALGAEGVSRDIDMLIGNGYCANHAEITLSLLGENRELRELFIARYR